MVEIDLSYTGETPVSPCPNCGSILDRTTGPAGGPKSGDATICVNCHHFCVFDEALKLRQPTTEEMKKMAGDRRFVALTKSARSLSVMRPLLKLLYRPFITHPLPSARQGRRGLCGVGPITRRHTGGLGIAVPPPPRPAGAQGRWWLQGP